MTTRNPAGMPMQDERRPDAPMFQGQPPAWALHRPKPMLQALYDLIGAPLRMVVLPDHLNERLHLTSLRAERMAKVLPVLEGRTLDIGAGDNMLLRLYRWRTENTDRHAAAEASVGLDVYDWGSGCTIVESCRNLPFADRSFDSVSFVACLNHIPERREALAEALRVLRPGGRLVVTMIGKLVGGVGHALWWYSEDKHREEQEGEVMGMDPAAVMSLVREAGFASLERHGFVYGLNTLYLARRP